MTSVRDRVIADIRKHKIIAIVRGIPTELIVDLTGALYAGGIRLIEVTFDQKGGTALTDTPCAITALCDTFGDNMRIGAGTVLTEGQVLAAADAGAGFIVSPNVNEAVIMTTRATGLVSIPGALTPTEIMSAHDFGADLIKLFPAGELGLGYVKAICAPLNHIDFLAVGGVDHSNIGSFFKAGMCGAGIGSRLADKALVMEKRFSELTDIAKAYASAVAE